MRLIDADAFDKALEDAQIQCKRNGGNFRFGVLSTVRANLENAPTVGEWVSVKDRLPEENQEYIVYVTDIEGEKCVTVDQWLSHARHWFLFDDKAESKVTHWMPLPPPPKEET